MVVCGMARQAECLKERLKVPLETAHLILVQNTPLSIRFRFDEKQFDVDGAYNIRYEIMKKRIDKAVIKGTSERLTQPGKIAIVYSQPWEVSEYRQYIDYLQASGYLTGQIAVSGVYRHDSANARTHREVLIQSSKWECDTKVEHVSITRQHTTAKRGFCISSTGANVQITGSGLNVPIL